MNHKRSLKVLVTGASGFLGQRIVTQLLHHGHEVVAFVRHSSNTSDLNRPGVTIAVGDVTHVESISQAAENVDAVVHAAADTAGTDEGGKKITVGGTNNVIGVVKSLNIKKFVYISSCSVYATATAKFGQLINEESALEPYPEERGAYSQYKLEAENSVTALMDEDSIPTVCLRPGAIYGPGTSTFSAMLGFSIADKYFLVIGRGKLIPPWTHVDNVAEAVCLSVENDAANGQVFNIVDSELVSKRQYIDRLIRYLHPRSRVVYLPYPLVLIATTVQEGLFRLVRRTPFLTRYRLKSSQCRALIDGARIRRLLEWTPSVTFPDAIENWKRR